MVAGTGGCARECHLKHNSPEWPPYACNSCRPLPELLLERVIYCVDDLTSDFLVPIPISIAVFFGNTTSCPLAKKPEYTDTPAPYMPIAKPRARECTAK